MAANSNLINPMRTFQVDPSNTAIDSCFKIEFITQDLYDLMNYHDPQTKYIITNSSDGRVYHGDIMVPKEKANAQYLLSINRETGLYQIFSNCIYDNIDHLVLIEDYNNPDDAISALTRYQNIGSGDEIASGIYIIINEYIKGNININNTIIGILNIFGFKEDPRLQQLHEANILYNKYSSSDKRISSQYHHILPQLATTHPNSLFNIYYSIYNIFEKYNFFMSDKYQYDNIDLHIEIHEIINILYNKK